MDEGVARFCAFGGSITRGYYNNGRSYHPYAVKLGELLEKEYSNRKFEIIEFGLNGETTKEMTERIKLIDFSEFEYFTFLAGLNDIAYTNVGKVKVESIAANIEQVMDHVLSHKHIKNVFIATIPTCVADLKSKQENPTHWYCINKETANKQIKHLVSSKASKDSRILLVDLDVHFNAYTMTPEEVTLLWSDSIHYSKEGYDKLGEVFFKVAKENKISF